MALIRPLSRPPIREAIIEVKSEPVDFARVDAVRDRLAAAYPVVRPFRMASVALHLPEERRGADTGQQTGWRCESADGREVALVRTDGLAFGRLAAYPGWDPFLDRFIGVWSTYVGAASPLELHRLSVRFVNDLRLPIGGQFDFERYLTSVPRAPAGLAPEMSDFLVQMTLPGGHDGLRVSVTQATDASARSDRELPVILDIDAGWDRRLPVDGDLPLRMTESLATMHALKNQVFFGLLTEEFVGMYT